MKQLIDQQAVQMKSLQEQLKQQVTKPTTQASENATEMLHLKLLPEKPPGLEVQDGQGPLIETGGQRSEEKKDKKDKRDKKDKKDNKDKKDKTTTSDAKPNDKDEGTPLGPALAAPRGGGGGDSSSSSSDEEQKDKKEKKKSKKKKKSDDDEPSDSSSDDSRRKKKKKKKKTKKSKKDDNENNNDGSSSSGSSSSIFKCREKLAFKPVKSVVSLDSWWQSVVDELSSASTNLSEKRLMRWLAPVKKEDVQLASLLKISRRFHTIDRRAYTALRTALDGQLLINEAINLLVKKAQDSDFLLSVRACFRLVVVEFAKDSSRIRGLVLDELDALKIKVSNGAPCYSDLPRFMLSLTAVISKLRKHVDSTITDVQDDAFRTLSLEVASKSDKTLSDELILTKMRRELLPLAQLQQEVTLPSQRAREGDVERSWQWQYRTIMEHLDRIKRDSNQERQERHVQDIAKQNGILGMPATDADDKPKTKKQKDKEKKDKDKEKKEKEEQEKFLQPDLE
jgi:hypothetical protein